MTNNCGYKNTLDQSPRYRVGDWSRTIMQLQGTTWFSGQRYWSTHVLQAPLGFAYLAQIWFVLCMLSKIWKSFTGGNCNGSPWQHQHIHSQRQQYFKQQFLVRSKIHQTRDTRNTRTARTTRTTYHTYHTYHTRNTTHTHTPTHTRNTHNHPQPPQQ